MAADEYKALTYVNLPFLDGNGRAYAPGQMIPHDAFEESVALAQEAMPDHDGLTSAEDMIAEMMEWGSISDDMTAEINEAHLPVVPGQPTVASLAQQARQLVAQYEQEGREVPQELAVFAEAIQTVQADDAGGGTSA